jgi:hypothetical protein
VTQSAVAELLQIKGADGSKACVPRPPPPPPSLTRTASVAAPATDKDGNVQASVPAVTTPVELTSVLAANAAAFSAERLPPAMPTAYKRWVPERAEDAPHDPDAYFPMLLVK